MKKRVFTGAVTALFCAFLAGSVRGDTLLHYPRLHQGLRSLGMGGAYTAVGGDMEGLFYNPATLTSMPFQIEIINPLAEADEDMIDIGEDFFDALDLETD
ncbi:MAG: hypothetical protein D6713_00885, partial [Deltaproteobacteria bacterium]